MKCTIVAAAALLWIAAGVQAQDAPTKDMTVVSEMTVWTVTLHPKAIESPLLQRMLLPRPEEFQPGNAALHYYSALMLHLRDDSKEDERVADFLTKPLNQLTDEEFTKVRLSESVLHEMETGAYRASAEWDHNIRTEGFRVLLPNLGPMRDLARGAALEARADIKGHHYDEAIRWLRVDYALARHLGAGDTLIEALLGVAVEETAHTQLLAMVGQPDAPNMFWPVATMPRLVDPVHAFQQERAAIYYTFPELKEAREGKFHPGQWTTFLERFSDMQDVVRSYEPKKELQTKAAQLAFELALYGPAKSYLAAHGFKPPEIEAMPVEEVLMRGVSAGYEEPADEGMVWMEVPYWQRTKRPLPPEEVSAGGGALGIIARLFSPALDRARLNIETTERSRAALANLEALRDYAAGHKGALPEKLDDISGLPIPWDPIWNRPFEYKKDGNHATLTGAPAAPDGIRSGLRVDITMEN